ncbi:MAG: hypothetical protein QW046_04295 [Candidatus Micrarchaeaceae archaeon]
MVFEVLIKPDDWKFVDNIDDLMNKACCDVMRQLIKNDVIGVDQNGHLGLPVDTHPVSYIPVNFCPGCGSPVITVKTVDNNNSNDDNYTNNYINNYTKAKAVSEDMQYLFKGKD